MFIIIIIQMLFVPYSVIFHLHFRDGENEEKMENKQNFCSSERKSTKIKMYWKNNKNCEIISLLYISIPRRACPDAKGQGVEALPKGSPRSPREAGRTCEVCPGQEVVVALAALFLALRWLKLSCLFCLLLGLLVVCLRLRIYGTWWGRC